MRNPRDTSCQLSTHPCLGLLEKVLLGKVLLEKGFLRKRGWSALRFCHATINFDSIPLVLLIIVIQPSFIDVFLKVIQFSTQFNLSQNKKSIYSTIYKGFCKKVPSLKQTDRKTLKIIYQTSQGTQLCLGHFEKEMNYSAVLNQLHLSIQYSYLERMI